LLTALLFVGFVYLSFGVCLILVSAGARGRGMLALFGLCWGLASWLPVARMIGLKGQIAHVCFAAVSWMLAWSLIWPGAMFPDPQNDPLGRSLAELLFLESQGSSLFHARLVALAVTGSAGSLVAVYLRLFWNRELRRELPLLPVFWSLAAYLSFVVVVEILSRGEAPSEYYSPEQIGGNRVIGAFTLALGIGSSVAAGFIGYWDRGNSLVRAIRSIPQSEDPRSSPKPATDTTEAEPAGHP
jgi:hypothetical protein